MYFYSVAYGAGAGGGPPEVSVAGVVDVDAVVGGAGGGADTGVATVLVVGKLGALDSSTESARLSRICATSNAGTSSFQTSSNCNHMYTSLYRK